MLTDTKTRKTNKKFMVLSALGIIMVVDRHCNNPLNLFNTFFPYNSFFMPLFIFISGYFNKVDNTTDLKTYIRKKEKSLLTPYILIVIVTFVLEQLIFLIKTGSLPQLSSGDFLVLLIEPFVQGAPVNISDSIWFVPSLFSVILVYGILKNILYKHWNNLVALLIFCFLNICVVYSAHNFTLNMFMLLPLKCLFFLPFYELGIFYRETIEPKLSSLKADKKVIILISLMLINVIRMMILPNPKDIEFVYLSFLNGFTSPFPITPFISSVIGILFWLTLVDTFGHIIYESRIINYISENTYMIMGFHLFFFYLLSLVLYIINSHIFALPEFDMDLYMNSTYYVWDYYTPFRLVYLLAGITGPLLIQLLIDKIKQRFNTPSCR